MSSIESASGDRAGPARRVVRRLPGDLIDQIAAGEVVERPASVVKELVENALDAGAARVRIEIRGGGRDWIAVADDGLGMSAADARLALERHATSKLSGPGDLSRIATFGFRGEALPAIAAVSKLRLRTRARGVPEGVELRIEAGRLLDERVASGPEGTRVEVSDLFGNVPARRKFLKSATTEWGHVADWLARAALALPAVHFEVRRDERAALVWPGVESPLDRIAAVLGEDEAAGLVPVSRREGRAGLSGFVSRPDRHRPTLAGVHLFVNRRPVRDRMLQHALLEVYRDLLPRGRLPSAVLFVDVPPEEVDVNVHPAKWEVRFADPQALHRLVRAGVRDAVAERRWIGAAPPGAAPTGASPRREPYAGGPPAGGGHTTSFAFAQAEPGFGFAGVGSGLATGVEPAGGRVRLGDLRLLGQLLGTYLVLESKEGLLLVDQHAAHERVLYERLRAEWIERGVESQGLLAPLTVSLSAPALAALEDVAAGVARLGFDLEPFGGDAVAVRAVPALLGERDPAGLVRGLADELVAAGPAADALRRGARSLEAAERVFASLACHSARRKGEVLDAREQRALLDGVDAIPWAPTCPHGRPVAVPLALAEIERRFGRR
jgi:DNA mismatch repair protein MutL